MSKGALKRLSIEHLRGSISPFAFPFEKGKKMTFIYGENGTGKSTICDSFEFLGKGRVGSLDNRGLGKTNRYWQTIGKKSTDVSVTLETTAGSCTGVMSKAEVVVSPAEQRPMVEVLRRSQIQSLIESQPKDRYAAISRFIDVTSAEASESSLRELIKDIEKNQGEAIARVHENLESINHFWEEAGKVGVDPVLWAVAEVNADISAFDADIQAIDKLRSAYNRIGEFPSRIEQSQKGLSAALAAQKEAQANLDQSAANVVAGAADIVTILQAAKGYLTKHTTPEVCPLCESGEKVAGLAGRVNERLASFASLQSAQAVHQHKGRNAEFAAAQLESVKKEAKAAAADFVECLGHYTWPADISVPSKPIPEELSHWPAWLAENQPLLDKWRQAEGVRQDKKSFINTLKRALETFTANVKAQKEIDDLLPKLKRALDIAEEERRTFTDATLGKIATEVGRLYEIVHPGEGLAKLSLELDPNKRASLEICADFCGQTGTPPQAYFSDSHLDTLGLCIFLALSGMDKPAETILVLDDILASIDEPHVERLIGMLYDETAKFRHCIITTHYKPWKQKLRWGWLPNGQCQFIELTKWSATNGITLTKSTPDIETLKSLLEASPPDPQLVCAKAGFVLEFALNFLAHLYECSVPLRANGLYTIGDLLPAIDKKLRPALRVEVLTGPDATGNSEYKSIALGPFLDELSRMAQARNVFGCHFNELSFELLDADALGFGQQVLELVQVLTDENAGWPRNGKSGSYWANVGETRQLHPYKKPS